MSEGRTSAGATPVGGRLGAVLRSGAFAVTGEIASGEVAPPARAALLDLFRGWVASGDGR